MKLSILDFTCGRDIIVLEKNICPMRVMIGAVISKAV